MTRDRRVRLTTTSYAVLGMIAARPSTPYDLAKRMRTNFEYFWPAARSHLHTEVKKLAGMGLVEGRVSATGSRRRTTYRVTREGERSLATWLASPPQTFRLEMEGLVRLYLAGLGTVDDLRQVIDSIAAEAETMLRIADAVIPAYLSGESGDLPIDVEAVHLRVLMVDFLVSFADLSRRWADRSASTVSAWNDLEPAGKTERSLATLRDLSLLLDRGNPPS